MNVMWCIMYVYTLLKVVKSHCDFTVLAVSLMGSNFFFGMGWVELYPIVLGFLEFF